MNINKKVSDQNIKRKNETKSSDCGFLNRIYTPTNFLEYRKQNTENIRIDKAGKYKQLGALLARMVEPCG